MSSLITLDQLKEAAPNKTIRNKFNQDLVDKVNKSTKDPIFREQFRNNIVGYMDVLKDGKFKISQYLEAVMYVSYKVMGKTNLDAYRNTFPHRYQEFLKNGTSDKDIASYVSSYNKNKLVNLVFEQTMIPTHVLNADIYQKAINIQAELMVSANSEKVRSDAANSLLTHLKPPETKKIELDVGVKDTDTIKDIRQATLDLVAEQKKMMQAGMMNVKEIAESQIITTESEVIDVN